MRNQQRDSGNIFSVHLISRAFQVLMSQGGSKAAVLVAAALSGDCVSASDLLQYPDIDSKGGRATKARLGISSGQALTPALLRPNKGTVRWLRVANAARPGRRGSSGPGRQASLMKAFCPRPKAGLNPGGGLAPGFFHLWPQISTHLLILTPPSWGSQITNTQNGNGILFC